MKKINYKLLALMPMFVLTGCGEKHVHKNIVIGKASVGNDKIFSVKDTKTREERVFRIGAGLNARSDFDCFKIGDTISIYTGGVYRSEKYYQTNAVLNSGEFGMSYNPDLIAARRKQQKIGMMNQNTKQR